MRVFGILIAASVALIFGGFVPVFFASNEINVPETEQKAAKTKTAIQAECDLTSAAQMVLSQAQVEDPKSQSVNGPTLIKVPEWVEDPLARYYLYFADHHGEYIRLAYADSPLGPFTIYSGGVLDVASSPLLADHVASPEIFVANGERKIYLAFHSPDPFDDRRQNSLLASSTDGLVFNLESALPSGSYLEPEPYVRLFAYEGMIYQIFPRHGLTFARADSITGVFEESPQSLGLEKTRHLSVLTNGNSLEIYFTTVGDSPERIKRTTVDLSQPWGTWKAGPVECVRAPEETWEGATLVPHPSQSGTALTPVNELRDPFVFVENGVERIYYSTAGENGIGVATVNGTWLESFASR